MITSGPRGEAIRDAELALLNAPFEEDGWRRAIAEVLKATDCDTANMVGLGGPLLLPLNFFVGRNAEAASSLFTDPSLWGPCNWRINSVTTPMAIQHDGHYAQYRERIATDPYDDAMSMLDLGSGCQSAVLMEEDAFLGLALARSRRKAPLGGAELDAFAYLRNSLQRAVRMQLALDGEAARNMLETGNFGGQATLLLDGHGRVCALSDSAVEMLCGDGPIQLSSAYMRLRCGHADARVGQALARLLAHDEDGFGPQVHQAAVGGGANGASDRWKISLVRLPRREHGLGFDPRVAVTVRQL